MVGRKQDLQFGMRLGVIELAIAQLIAATYDESEVVRAEAATALDSMEIPTSWYSVYLKGYVMHIPASEDNKRLMLNTLERIDPNEANDVRALIQRKNPSNPLSNG